MATYVQARQPFAALDGARLQALGSVKNRQNAISTLQSLSSPTKPTCTAFNTPTKRRLASPDIFDDFDSENVDPNIVLTPSKRTKGLDGASITKPSKFILTTDAASKPLSTPIANAANTSAKRKATAALSLSVPAPATTATPIGHSRGSPKHKRVGLLSRKLGQDSRRRFSSSPFRRIDPSNHTSAQGALPFSIDAALSGTISSYAPPADDLFSSLEEKQKSMPPSWFFAIHADTAEEEAANLMEHSASVLDISSDDDAATSRKKRDEEERGKENVPPPDFVAPLRRGHGAGDASSSSLASILDVATHKGVSDRRRVASLKGDVMAEDRKALGALDERDFFPEGLDGASVVVVEAEKGDAVATTIEEVTEKEVDVVVEAAVVQEEVVIEAAAVQDEIVVCED